MATAAGTRGGQRPRHRAPLIRTRRGPQRPRSECDQRCPRRGDDGPQRATGRAGKRAGGRVSAPPHGVGALASGGPRRLALVERPSATRVARRAGANDRCAPAGRGAPRLDDADAEWAGGVAARGCPAQGVSRSRPTRRARDQPRFASTPPPRRHPRGGGAGGGGGAWGAPSPTQASHIPLVREAASVHVPAARRVRDALSGTGAAEGGVARSAQRIRRRPPLQSAQGKGTGASAHALDRPRDHHKMCTCTVRDPAGEGGGRGGGLGGWKNVRIHKKSRRRVCPLVPHPPHLRGRRDAAGVAGREDKAQLKQPRCHNSRPACLAVGLSAQPPSTQAHPPHPLRALPPSARATRRFRWIRSTPAGCATGPRAGRGGSTGGHPPRRRWCKQPNPAPTPTRQTRPRDHAAALTNHWPRGAPASLAGRPLREAPQACRRLIGWAAARRAARAPAGAGEWGARSYQERPTPATVPIRQWGWKSPSHLDTSHRRDSRRRPAKMRAGRAVKAATALTAASRASEERVRAARRLAATPARPDPGARRGGRKAAPPVARRFPSGGAGALGGGERPLGSLPLGGASGPGRPRREGQEGTPTAYGWDDGRQSAGRVYCMYVYGTCAFSHLTSAPTLAALVPFWMLTLSTRPARGRSSTCGAGKCPHAGRVGLVPSLVAQDGLSPIIASPTYDTRMFCTARVCSTHLHTSEETRRERHNTRRQLPWARPFNAIALPLSCVAAETSSSPFPGGGHVRRGPRDRPAAASSPAMACLQRGDTFKCDTCWPGVCRGRRRGAVGQWRGRVSLPSHLSL